MRLVFRGGDGAALRGSSFKDAMKFEPCKVALPTKLSLLMIYVSIFLSSSNTRLGMQNVRKSRGE